MKLAELYTEVTIRDSGFNSGLAGINSKLSVVSASLDKISSIANTSFSVLSGAASAAYNVVAFAAKTAYGIVVTATKAATVVTLSFIGVIGLAVRAYGLQEQAERKVASAIAATSKAAGFSVKEIKKMASALQSLTTFSDEAILSSQALLLTFTEIKGDNFKEATIAMLNLSVAMDQGLRQSAIQLGKALNDPIKGVNAMAEAGVSFTKQQKEMIKVMQESGRIADAQRLIFKALAEQGMGGAAEAAAKAFIGRLKQMKNEANSLLEVLGKPWATAFIIITDKMRKAGLSTDFWREKIKAFNDYLLNVFAPNAISVFGSLEAQVRVLSRTWKTEWEIIKLQFDSFLENTLIAVGNWGVDLKAGIATAIQSAVANLPQTGEGLIKAILFGGSSLKEMMAFANKLGKDLRLAQELQYQRKIREIKGTDLISSNKKILESNIKLLRLAAGVDKVRTQELEKQKKLNKERLAVIKEIVNETKKEIEGIAIARRPSTEERAGVAVGAAGAGAAAAKGPSAGILGIAELARKIQKGALTKEDKEQIKQTKSLQSIDESTSAFLEGLESLGKELTGSFMGPLAL